MAALTLAAGPADAKPVDAAWGGLAWGANDAVIVQHLGSRATLLRQPIDFGDSYVDIILREVEIGGYRLIAYYQMDKKTRGLKRVQVERSPHGANPPAFRAITAALVAAYGPPSLACEAPPTPANGYQAATEQLWQRGDIAIRAIFRDTTLEAYEGCYFPPCGLTGRLLIRICPAATEAARCTTPAARQKPG